MRVQIFGGAVLALLASVCFAQPSINVPSGTGADAVNNKAQADAMGMRADAGANTTNNPIQSQKSQPSQPASQSVAAKPAPQPATFNGRPAVSKILFHSRPSGARIALPDGKSCVAPCSITVGYNEKFTAVATKRGYFKKEFEVSPSVTDLGRAQIIGSALGAGVVGLVVGAAIADRAYGPEPVVVELVADPTGPAPSERRKSASR